jgi:hypothetical protein
VSGRRTNILVMSNQEARPHFGREIWNFNAAIRMARRRYETLAAELDAGPLPEARLQETSRLLGQAAAESQLTFEARREHDGQTVHSMVGFDYDLFHDGTQKRLAGTLLQLSHAKGSIGLIVRETGSEYTQHAVKRFIERAGGTSESFLKSLPAAEIVSQMIMLLKFDAGAGQQVIAPFGTGVLVGEVKEYPYRETTVGTAQAKRGVFDNATPITAASRIVWRTYMGEDMLSPSQRAAMNGITAVITAAMPILRPYLKHILIGAASLDEAEIILCRFGRKEIVQAFATLKAFLQSRYFDRKLASLYREDRVVAAIPEMMEALQKTLPQFLWATPIPNASAGKSPAEVAAAIAEKRAIRLRNFTPNAQDWHFLTAEVLSHVGWSMSQKDIRGFFQIDNKRIARRCTELGVLLPPSWFWEEVEAGMRPHPRGIAVDLDAPNADASSQLPEFTVAA